MTPPSNAGGEGREVLAPCPFCGADATWREDDPARPYEPFGLIVDHSGDCFLRGVVNFDRDSITSTWNTRPARENADDRAPALVEAAVAEMRERAAKVADLEGMAADTQMSAGAVAAAGTAARIAAAIRALPTPSQEASNVG